MINLYTKYEASTLTHYEDIQEGLAVSSIARDDPSPLPGMHRTHMHCDSQCMRAHCGLRPQSAVNLDRNLKP